MSASDPERAGPWRRLRARPGLLAAGAVAAVAVVAFVLWWFQPQALFIDRTVDEEFPAAEGPDTAADDDGEASEDGTAGPAEDDPVQEPEESETPEEDATDAPRALFAGGFESRGNYTVTGEATVYELEDGRLTLRLEPFESTNGPDLFVYLTAADHADPDEALGEDFVDLGQLRGNIGNQNYEIPAGVDLDTYDTVAIWCRRFTVGFGTADLEPATG